MAENYILIHDIMAEHHARMRNLRKYYPFFVLNETTFQQYKEGRYRMLDMGYITMATLRFFIHENQFNEKQVDYESYSIFLAELLSRDFHLSLESEEEQELIGYIFDKIKNDGRPFEFHYFDPEDGKTKTSRIRLIDSEIKEGTVVYFITPEGIEFYLDTKEVKDQSDISVQQLLLEKMIGAKNFRGGIDVVKRINSEVNRLILEKDSVISLLGHDVFEGAKACDRYMETVTSWFEEEQKLFEKNTALLDQALRMDDAGKNTAIHELDTELKKTIHRHGCLIAASTDLQKKADEMIRQAKLRRLRPAFDFQGRLQEMKKKDDISSISILLAPLFQPKIEKSFAISSIDHMLTYRTGDPEQGEKVKKGAVDRDFQYEDELEEERIAHNYGRLFAELLDQLEKKGRIDLMEWTAILEIQYGEEFLKNRDYYGFLVHLLQKKSYDMQEMREHPETFLEHLVPETWTEEELNRFAGAKILLTAKPEEEIPLAGVDEGFYITNVVIEKEQD